MSRRIMFVGLDTGTIESCDSSSRIVDLDAVEYVPDGDDYADDVRVIDLAREHGVPVAELWAAYKREQQREAPKKYFTVDAVCRFFVEAETAIDAEHIAAERFFSVEPGGAYTNMVSREGTWHMFRVGDKTDSAVWNPYSSGESL